MMNPKSLDEIKTIEEVTLEMSETKRKLKELPKRAIKEIIILTFLAITFPFLPGRRGRKPMIENWEYGNALVFVSILFAFVYLISYFWRKDKLEKRIRELKLKEYLIQKQ